jgi:hypothetical protein
MDDETLSARLKDSRPPTIPRDDRLHAAVDELIIASRPEHHRRKRWLLGGVSLSVLLLGGTTTALASEPLLEWLGFTPDQSLEHANADGDYCVAGIIVRPEEGVAADDASFLAAKNVLLGIDFDTLEIPESIRNGYAYSPEAEAEKTASIDEYNAAHPESTIQPAPSDPESSMLIAAAYKVIVAGVESEGLDSGHFWLEAGGTCDEATR